MKARIARDPDRRRAERSALPTHSVLRLQATAGNSAVTQLLQRMKIDYPVATKPVELVPQLQRSADTQAVARAILARCKGEKVKGATVPEMTEAVKSLRTDLTDKAAAIFDDRWARVAKGKTAADAEGPFMKVIDAFKGREGGLKAALEAEWRKFNVQPAAKPFGERVGDLPELGQQLDTLIREIESHLAGAGQGLVHGERLAKSAKHLRDAALADLTSGKKEAHAGQIDSLRNNLGGVRAEFEEAKKAPAGTEIGAYKGEYEIDQVSPDGMLWVNVKNYNLFPVEDPRVADLEKQALNNLVEAMEHARGDRVPAIEFRFVRGVTKEVKEAIEAVKHEGHKPTVTGEIKTLGT